LKIEISERIDSALGQLSDSSAGVLDLDEIRNCIEALRDELQSASDSVSDAARVRETLEDELHRIVNGSRSLLGDGFVSAGDSERARIRSVSGNDLVDEFRRARAEFRQLMSRRRSAIPECAKGSAAGLDDFRMSCEA